PSSPLIWVRRPASSAANSSRVNVGSRGSGPSRAIPGTACTSRTTYTASDFFVPASVRSKPLPSSSATRSAMGGATGLDERLRQLVVPSQPARLGEMEHQVELLAHGDVDELPVPSRAGDHGTLQGADGRIERLQCGDRGHADPRDGPPRDAFTEEVDETLHLRHLRHAAILSCAPAVA